MTKQIELLQNMTEEEDMQLEPAPYDPDDIDERRRELFLMRMRGCRPYKEIYPALAKKYNCTEHALVRDWHYREKWIGKIAALADAESLIADAKGTGEFVLQTFREFAHEISKELDRYRDEDDNLDWSPNSPVPSLLAFLKDYLKALLEGNTTCLKNMQLVDVLREAPKRLQIDSRSVEAKINIDAALSTLSPEDRLKFMQAAFGERTRKEDANKDD